MTGSPRHPGARLRRPGRTPVAVLAHRGGLGSWRENTIEAFEGALALGADGVELDVRLGADLVPLVHHDAAVPGYGSVEELSAKRRPRWLPTLEEAMAACAGALVNVEIKNPPFESGHDPAETIAGEVVRVLSRLARSPAERRPANVVVSSFQATSLAAVRSEDAGVAIGLLVPPFLEVSDRSAGSTSPSLIEQASRLGCAAMHLHHEKVTSAVVEQVHEAGMAVVTWTVNDQQRLRAVVGAGVDVVITDEVESTLGYLGGRAGLVRGVNRRGQSSS